MVTSDPDGGDHSDPTPAARHRRSPIPSSLTPDYWCQSSRQASVGHTRGNSAPLAMETNGQLTVPTAPW